MASATGSWWVTPAPLTYCITRPTTSSCSAETPGGDSHWFQQADPATRPESPLPETHEWRWRSHRPAGSDSKALGAKALSSPAHPSRPLSFKALLSPGRHLCSHRLHDPEEPLRSTSLCLSLPAGSEEAPAASASQSSSALHPLPLHAAFQDGVAGVVLFVYQ